MIPDNFLTNLKELSSTIESEAKNEDWVNYLTSESLKVRSHYVRLRVRLRVRISLRVRTTVTF